MKVFIKKGYSKLYIYNFIVNIIVTFYEILYDNVLS